MTHKVRTVRKDTPVSEVAKIMVRDRVNRVPVVDEDNKLVGIIARADIIKSMVNEADKE
jgi:CBS domain-containing protein